MEAFTTYKLPDLSERVPFVPPPYCRKATKEERGETEEIIPSLKLIVSNPSKLLTLYETLVDNSSKALEVKLNSYLIKEGECKSVFLLHLRPSHGDAFVQTIGTVELENSLRFPLTEEIISKLVIYENKCLKCNENLIPELLSVFQEMFDNLKYKIMAVPIVKPNEHEYTCSLHIQPSLLACFVDSKKNEDFVTKLANELFKYALPVLLNLMAAEEETREKRQYQTLLGVIRKLFSSVEDVNVLIQTITEEVKKIVKTRGCSLFLADEKNVDLITRVFNTFSETKFRAKVKISKNYDIPDYVTTTGKTVNIENIVDNPSSDENMNKCEEVEAQNILCFPLRNEEEIIGAVQLCNKRTGHFSYFDEEIVNYLSTLCGMFITHSFKYTAYTNCKIRNQLENELMIYQIQVKEEDVSLKTTCPLIHQYLQYDQFSFNPRTVPQMETACFVNEMFEILGYFTKFSVDKNVFTRFVMHVRSGCRNVPYHNWLHLLSSAHFAFLCLKNLELLGKEYITPLEGLALFIACLCHDVDYRGIQNPFEQETNTTLASLYSSAGSVTARHRLSQILRILNVEGCNFLQNLDRETYNLVVNLIKDFILAADLSSHFKFYKKHYDMIRSGYNRNNPEHRYIFGSLLVTCADLSDFTKDWSVVKEASIQLLKELFTHGDLEKENVDFTKTPVTEPYLIPHLCSDFLRNVCLPAFQLLAALFPTLKELVGIIKRHILYWECSKYIFERAVTDGISWIEVVSDEDFDKKIEIAVQMVEEQK